MAYTRYYRDITVQNNESEDLTDYQVCIEISDIDFFIKADPNNLVIVDGDTILPYWVETWKRPDGKARIWTKMDLPASGSKTIKIYYGGYIDWINQDGDDVFEFFDDFDVANYTVKIGEETQVTIGSSKLRIDATSGYDPEHKHIIVEDNKEVSITGDFIIEGHMYLEKPDEWAGWYVDTNGNGYGYTCGWYGWGGTGGSIERRDGWGIHESLQREIPHYIAPQGLVQILRWDRVNNEFRLWDTDGSQIIATATDTTYDNFIRVAVRVGFNSIWQVDWVRVRKYTSNEPTITISPETEETRYWLQSPTGTLTGQVCDKNGNIITGTSVDVIVLNKDTKEVENVTTSNAEDGSWEVEVQSGKKLVVLALEGTYGEDTDIAGAEFLKVE